MLPTTGTFRIIVKPDAHKNEIIGYDESRQAYRIGIKARAEKDAANKEIIRFLSKILNKKVKIISGLRSREKLIKIDQKD